MSSKFIMLAGLLVMLNACAAARMALPPEIGENFQHWPVTERGYFVDETFAFGPYRLEDVDRSWTTKSRWGAGGGHVQVSDAKARQSYNFRLTTPQFSGIQATCFTNAAWTQLELDDVLGNRSVFTWDLRSKASLSCTFTSDPGAARWTLVAQQSEADGTLNGGLSNGLNAARISSTRALEGTSWPFTEASGYLLELNGEIIAAVEVLNDGRVWIKRELDPKLDAALAAGAATLLLYREIGQW